MAAAHHFYLCEANGRACVSTTRTPSRGQAISVHAASHISAYRLMASWHEDDSGRPRFVGAAFPKHYRSEPMALTPLGEAKRFVELYGHGTDVSRHPYVPERDGCLEKWRQRS